MAIPSESFLTGANIDFIEAQYARFLVSPAAVDQGWRELFDSVGREGRPLVIDGLRLAPVAAPFPVAGATVPAEAMGLQSKVAQTVQAFRLRGHLLADLDPLGQPRKQLEHVADLGLASPSHFSPAELESLVDPVGSFPEPRVPLKRVLERMRRTYCHHIGVEYSHLYDSERRSWLRHRMEHAENTTAFSADEQRAILRKLTEAETFESTIHLKFQGQKRFSAEGGETQVAMLADLLELGAELGVREVVFGMAHRGRLNVLANILGKPADEIFAEIAGPADPTMFLNRSDVKYHMGYSKDWVTRKGKTLHLSMAFNPSHLGFVYPVVVGRVRAKQERMGGGESARHAGVPVVIHGDAAFAGQGLVAETLNLAGLGAYDVGGTIHLVVNNQIGYTTEASQGRTPLYCTGMAQLLDIPVFHVNGDDPEACVHVMRVATEYRQRFHTDVVIDLVCYRKYGHNEGDEPAFTQPMMYRAIRAHQTVRQRYAADLAAKGRLSAEESKGILEECVAGFTEAHARSRVQRSVKDPSHLLGLWAPYVGGLDRDSPQVETGVPEATLKRLLEPLARVPEAFTLHPNVMKGVILKRQAMLRGEELLDWGTGETLAYATLLAEGTRVRLTGQDTERGTFAHRQAVLHCQATGKTAFPLGDLAPGLARIENSPLSEMACMAFEFGYALDYPDALVAWEAQFGDFANNAQVMIDQFLASGEDKWKRMNGLTLLLPHGYEGAGPEHSSARLERFLELAAEDNLQICYPTSAAQIFHLLRRQVRRRLRKPLVVMTPKSLLRLAEACSPWSDFTHGTYRRVIGEVSGKVAPAQVTRLLLCSGKVYFDLVRQRDAGDATVAIARLEQLYPLPVEELQAVLATYPSLAEVFWTQEEPRNGGSWRNLREPLQALLQPRGLTLEYRGRPETASPATGFLSTHQYEQKLLVEEALSRGPHVR